MFVSWTLHLHSHNSNSMGFRHFYFFFSFNICEKSILSLSYQVQSFFDKYCSLAGKVLAIMPSNIQQVHTVELLDLCNRVVLPYAALTRFLIKIQICLHKRSLLLALLPTSSPLLKFEDFCKSMVLPAFLLQL